MDADMLKLLSDGFDTMKTTFTSIIGLAIPVTMIVVTISGGINFAFKKIRGVLSKAS